jgi:hypothetical protein
MRVQATGHGLGPALTVFPKISADDTNQKDRSNHILAFHHIKLILI